MAAAQSGPRPAPPKVRRRDANFRWRPQPFPTLATSINLSAYARTTSSRHASANAFVVRAGLADRDRSLDAR